MGYRIDEFPDHVRGQIRVKLRGIKESAGTPVPPTADVPDVLLPGPRVLRTRLQMLAPSLNGDKGLIRMNHHQYTRLRRDWVSALARAHWESDGDGDVSDMPVAVVSKMVITRHYARQPLDIDNLFAACKVPLDACRRAGIIAEDNPDALRSLACFQVKVDGVDQQHTLIEICY